MKKFKSEFIKSKTLLNNFNKYNSSRFKFYGISNSKKDFSFRGIFNKIFNNTKNNKNENTHLEEINNNNNNPKQFLRNKDRFKAIQREQLAPEFQNENSNSFNKENINNENTKTNSNTNLNSSNNQNKNFKFTETENSTQLQSSTELQNTNSIATLKQKYELYAKYDRTDLLLKDQEFGDVVKYEDFLDKGLEKFDSTLSKFYNNNEISNASSNNNLQTSAEYESLSKLVDEKSKLLYTNYKEEYKYNLAPYEERWYKEAIYSKANNDLEFIKLADNMKKRSNPIRNRSEFAQLIESSAKAPLHAQYPTKVETPFEAFIDPFQYLFNTKTKETQKFLKSENAYKNKICFRFNHVYEEILGEFAERELLSPKCAFQINEDLIVFQKIGDELSLYTVQADCVEPLQRGFVTDVAQAQDLLELDELNEKAQQEHFEQQAHKPRKSLFGSLFSNKNNAAINKNLIKNNKNTNKNENENKNKKNFDVYSKSELNITQLFGLEDLINLNSVYTDPAFLDFSKRLLEKLDQDETGLESFEICPKGKYLFLFFDVTSSPEGGAAGAEMHSQNANVKANLNTFNFEADSAPAQNKPFDILIKDLHNGILLPVVLHNCDVNVGFDKFDGVFYTQKDFSSRFSKIFRHQLGKAQKLDRLIYHEKNKDFKVSTYNCNSREYVYVEISTVSSPKINEIWFKPANDLDKVDFFCFKKIEKNVNYAIKYSNNAFYLLTNKTDSYDKVLKKILWSKNNTIAGMLEYSEVNKHKEKVKETENDLKSELNKIKNLKEEEADNDSKKTNLVDADINNKIISNSEPQTIENFLPSPLGVRDDISSEAAKNQICDIYTDIILQDAKQNSLLKIVQDLIKPEDNINIIDFQVFKNYIAVLEETEKKRQIKILNLKTNTSYIHEPLQEKTLISLSENYNFSSNYLRYIQSSPISAHSVTDYSLGTRKSYKIHKNFYNKINFKDYECEVFHVKDRHGGEAEIPVQIFYNKKLYSAEAPMILYTKGAQGRRQDFEFDPLLFSLLDRGFVWAIPQVRGSKFFDFDWYAQGVAENKIKHFTDFIDVATHLLDKKITERLVLYGDGYSGAITASLAFLQSPEDYAMLVANNGAFDVLDLCMFGARDNVQILEEFGDVKQKGFYELIKMFSPYHCEMPVAHKPVLICAEENSEYFAHGIKFAAKLRNNNRRNKFRNEIIFESFEDKFSYEEKIGFIYSQIVGNLYYN